MATFKTESNEDIVLDPNGTGRVKILDSGDNVLSIDVEALTGNHSLTLPDADVTLPSGTLLVSGGALGTPSGGTLSSCDAATETAKGVVELATSTEINDGTDPARAVCPDQLAASDFGIVYVSFRSADFTSNLATGDGKDYLHIPPALNGMNLVYVHARVITAGTTGTTDFQIANVTDTVDMLSTKLTIDSAETGSDTAATAAVINAATDDVATNDVLRLDLDAVSTTAPKGYIVTLGFRKP